MPQTPIFRDLDTTNTKLSYSGQLFQEFASSTPHFYYLCLKLRVSAFSRYWGLYVANQVYLMKYESARVDFGGGKLCFRGKKKLTRPL